MVAHQTSGTEVPGSNLASPTMILMSCRMIVYSFLCQTIKGGKGRGKPTPEVKNKIFKKTNKQGCELIFLYLKKINHDQIDLVNLWKRLTPIESILSIFEKYWFDLYQDQIDILITKNNWIFSIKNLFFICFCQYFHLFMPKDWITPVNLRSFLKINWNDSLSSICEKDWPWSNQSSW